MKKLLSLSAFVALTIMSCSKEEKTSVKPAAVESAVVQSQAGISTDTVINPATQTGKKKVVKVKYPRPKGKGVQ
ncbi:hypothetical protein I5907_16080 [Panacibacter sp. DH6]|uniref:Uncharacterized protein n=1 Tax=Panacibacter microcysteis TaxID=2793269 RepID=A0A931EBS3_9BACT|nr:hypothetical protein [Panacibacter microcysteis]MBG9377761.1 hypothetical protein [Panacibacter microcysteis]